MNNDKPVEIKLNKSKLIFMILGSAVFAGLGAWLLVDPPSSRNVLFNNPTLTKIAAISAILFFGLCLISLAVKLGDKKPGLIISNKGIMEFRRDTCRQHIME